MNNLLLQLYIEYKLSGAIPYIASHPELGLKIGIFNIKNEPNYHTRVKNIKKLGLKGNKQSYNIAKLLGIKNPIPSYVEDDEIEDNKDNAEELYKIVKELREENERLARSQENYNSELKESPKAWKTITDSMKKASGAANIYRNMITNTAQKMSSIIYDTGEQYNISEKIAESYKRAAFSMGMTTKQTNLQKKSFQEASVYAARYGITTDDIQDSMTEMSKVSGRLKFFTEDELNRFSMMQAAFSISAEEAGEISDRFDLMGISIEKGFGYLEESFQESRKLGLNAKKVMETMEQNFAAMQRMSFKGGVKAMTEMSRLAVRMRMDVSEMLGMADKFYNPEQAIEAVAELQLMGGEIANAFGDPFEVMYMARNKPEELAKKLETMTENMVVFNEKTGEYELPPEAKQQLEFMADKLGQSKDKIIDLAYQSTKLKDIKDAMGGNPMFDEDEQDAIAQMAKFKDGEWVVTVGEEDLSLNSAELQQAVEDGLLVKDEDAQENSLEQMVDNSQTTNELLERMIDSFEKGVSIKTDFYTVGENVLKKSIQSLGDALPDIQDAIEDQIKAATKDTSNPLFRIFNDQFQKEIGDKMAQTVDGALGLMKATIEGDASKDVSLFLNKLLQEYIAKANIQKTEQGNEQVLNGGDFIYTKSGEMINYDDMDDVMGMKSGGAIDKLLDLARGNMSSNGNNTTTLAGSASINVNIKSDNPSLNLSGMEDKIVNVITKVFNNGGDPNSIYLATKPNAASQQTT